MEQQLDIITFRMCQAAGICANWRSLFVDGSPMLCKHGNWVFQCPLRGLDVWTGLWIC